MSDLYVKQLRVGPMENFVYLVGSLSKRECMVVDPAWDIEAIVNAAAHEGMTITGALITHYHPDHCGGHLWGHNIDGVANLLERNPMPVYANKHEIEGLIKVTGLSKNDFKACEGGDILTVGGVSITTIHTPGHTPGSQCFLCDNALVSGDTLFITGCGRVDLPGGNPEHLYESLTNKIAKLPPTTILYPGHNYDAMPFATLHDVALKNPYLSAPTFAGWKQLMG